MHSYNDGGEAWSLRRSTTVKYCLRHAPAHLSSRRARTINKQGTKGTPHRLTPPLHCSRPPPRAPLPLRRRNLQRVVPSTRSGNRAPQVPLAVALALPPTSPFSPSVPPGNRPAQAQPSHWRRAARSATPCGTALWCSKASRSPGLVVLESEPRLPPYPSAVPQGNRAPHPARAQPSFSW